MFATIRKWNRDRLLKNHFGKWVESATEQELSDYADTLPLGKEINYAFKQTDELVFTTIKKIGLVLYGRGNYDGDVNVGDILLCNTPDGKIGRFIVLYNEVHKNIDLEHHYTYIICIGFKN